MKIGLFTPSWPGDAKANGITTSVFNLANGFLEIGHDPVILTRQIEDNAPEEIPIIPMPSVKKLWSNKLRARLNWLDPSYNILVKRISSAAEEAIRTHGISVLIMEETKGWAAGVAKHLPIPVVVTMHGPWLLHAKLRRSKLTRQDRQRIAQERLAFASAAGLLSPSLNVLKAVEATIQPHNGQPRAVIANALRPSTHLPSAAESDQPNILFVGRFDRHKGGDIVLKAFAHLHESCPEATLTFVGPDRGFEHADGSIVQIAAALNTLPKDTRRRISYQGTLPGREIAKLRKTHPIAVIASRYENLNYTLLEAMASGAAIVCTKVGGPAEILCDGETALLVPPDDPEALAYALRRLVRDPELTRRLGCAAREVLETRFAPAPIAQKTITFLETVLESCPISQESVPNITPRVQSEDLSVGPMQ